MGSSESDGAQQRRSMFKAKGLTLIKEAVNGLVKSSPLKEPTDFPETTTLISLTSLKSRIDAALTAQGGSPATEARSCSRRNLRSQPSTSGATDFSAVQAVQVQGPKRGATAMTAHNESPTPTLLKKTKVEREQSPDSRNFQSYPINDSARSPEQTVGGKRSLRSGKSYTSTGASSKVRVRPKPSGQPTSPVAVSSSYETPVAPPYIKREPLEEPEEPRQVQEAPLPCDSPTLSPLPNGTPKSLPGTSRIKVEPADTPSSMWDIPPRLCEDMRNVVFRHFSHST
ncbi:unnamed protein product [Ixodes hexagonus]